MDELPSLDRIRKSLTLETAFVHYVIHITTKARNLGLKVSIGGGIEHHEDPWGELYNWMCKATANADEKTRDEFRKWSFLYLERTDELLARYPHLANSPYKSIWGDALEGKAIPQDLSPDEIDLLDAVGSDTDPLGTLQSTLNKNKVLLKSDFQKKLIAHIYNMVFVNSITALEAYLAATVINRTRNNRPLLRRFVESNPQFKERKFSLSEVFTKYETIDKDARQCLVGILWHDLWKAKNIYESVFGITFPEITDLGKAVSKRHDLVHRNGYTADGKTIEVSRADAVKLIDQIEQFQQALEAQLAMTKI